MHRIDSPGATQDQYFTEGDPVVPVPPTEVSADWLNAVQEEISHVVETSGLTLDKADNRQLIQAILRLTVPVARKISVLAPLTVSNGGQLDKDLLLALGYPLVYPGAFDSFYEQVPPPGWAVRNGALLSNVRTAYPELLAELRLAKNSWKCKTQAQWTALSNAAPWAGIGGVPYFVVDISADTIRLPDTRGMYLEDAGFDGLVVGGVHGDTVRNVTGALYTPGWYSVNVGVVRASGGVFSDRVSGGRCISRVSYTTETNAGYAYQYIDLDLSTVVPTGNKVAPRAFGALGCVYVGGN